MAAGQFIAFAGSDLARGETVLRAGQVFRISQMRCRRWMTHGGSIVLQESFEPGEAIVLIERERCTVYYGMANIARALREHPSHPARRLGAMRTGLTIGPPEDIAMTIEALGAAELCNVYGATETYGNCAVTEAPVLRTRQPSRVSTGK